MSITVRPPDILSRPAPVVRRTLLRDLADGLSNAFGTLTRAAATLGRNAAAQAPPPVFPSVAAGRTGGLGFPPGSVRLVGAGPGDPDLLTLAAVRAIGQADVILHDHLVGGAVLDFARPDARLIPVGKRGGRPSMRQDAINDLLLAEARSGRRVVRLKGGDPFLFGRGGEEAAHLRAHGVPVTVVPGITAAAGCAARAGIPLTHRGLSRGLHLVTAHRLDGGPSEEDLAALVRTGDTLVFYMGRDRLEDLACSLIRAGLSADTPACAIENGTTLEERRCFAPLHALPARAARLLGDGPTLILVGEVIGLSPSHPDGQAAVAGALGLPVAAA